MFVFILPRFDRREDKESRAKEKCVGHLLALDRSHFSYDETTGFEFTLLGAVGFCTGGGMHVISVIREKEKSFLLYDDMRNGGLPVQKSARSIFVGTQSIAPKLCIGGSCLVISKCRKQS